MVREASRRSSTRLCFLLRKQSFDERREMEILQADDVSTQLQESQSENIKKVDQLSPSPFELELNLSPRFHPK